jgi:hypothetical protein
MASASALRDLKVLWFKTVGKYPRKWRGPSLMPECPRRGVRIFVVQPQCCKKSWYKAWWTGFTVPPKALTKGYDHASSRLQQVQAST